MHGPRPRRTFRRMDRRSPLPTRRWLALAATGTAVVAAACVVAPGVALASNGRASMTFAVSAQTSVYGTTVTLTAEMADDSGSCLSWRDCDTPAGRVDFFDNDVYVGSGTLGDHGPGVLHYQSYTQIDTTPAYAGYHHYRAQYSGDFDPVGSDDLRSIGRGQPNLTVDKADCNLSLLLDRASTTDQDSTPATFTADLGSGGHAGTIDFLLAGGSLYARRTITDGRSATFAFDATRMPAATYTIHAVYYGDSNHNGCTSVAVSHVREESQHGSGTVEVPRAFDDQFHVDMNTSTEVDILANDLLVPAYPTEPRIVTGDGYGPLHGTATLDEDTWRITYTPEAGFHGIDWLAYKLVDPAAPTTSYGDEGVVTFNVDCRAAGHDDAFTAVQDTALVVADPGVTGNDQACGGGVTVLAQPPHGTVSLGAGGGFTYTPAAGFTGLDPFQYTLDQDSAHTPVTATMVVVPSDCAVALADDAYTTTGPLVVDSPGLVGNDELCGNAVDVAQPPSHGSVEIAPGGGFTYTPDAGYAGPDTFTYAIVVTPDESPQVPQAIVTDTAATVHLTVVAEATTTEPTTTTTTSTPTTTSTVPVAAAPTPTDPTPTAPGDPALPVTGSNPAPLALAALGALIAGCGLLRLTRRRPAH